MQAIFSDLCELGNNLWTFGKESNWFGITVKAVLFFASHLPEQKRLQESKGQAAFRKLKTISKKQAQSLSMKELAELYSIY